MHDAISRQALVADVLALDDQRIRAMLAGDVARLRALLHPALEYTHSDGRSDTRDSYLEALASGLLCYRSAQRESVHAEIHGDVAILHGVFRLQALDQGQEKLLRIHFLANWVQDAGGDWSLRAWASTRLA